MIKNAKQASSAKETLSRLKEERNELLSKESELSEIRFETTLNSFDSLIEELQEDIAYYENLITDGYHCFTNKSLSGLSDLLIAARLAQGLTQRDLALIIGIQEQQIQRYEQADYESASYVRLQEVAEALNIMLEFKDVKILGKQINFLLPNNVEPEVIIQAETFLKSKSSLVF